MNWTQADMQSGWMFIVFILLAALPILGLFLLVYNCGIAPYLRQGKLKKAREEGRVVTATLDKYEGYNGPEDGTYRNCDFASYKYVVNGVVYHYHHAAYNLPDTLELYYPKGKPRKADLGGSYGHWQHKFLAYCGSVAVAAVVYVVIYFVKFGFGG